MSDLESVKKSIQNDRNYYKLHEVDKLINCALAQLWGNEDVVKVLIGCTDDSQSFLLLLTNKNRIIRCYETKRTVKVLFFDTIEYEHSAGAYDMAGVDSNKCRLVERKTDGFFGKTFYDVIFDEVTNNGYKIKLTFTFNEQSQAQSAMNAIVSNIKTYGKTTDTATATSSSSAGSAVAEIRKMYEDGIIDKAEMLDLIKALNK